MKMTKWMVTAALAMVVASATKADDWWKDRFCYGNGNGAIFNANEFSMDLFGEYKDVERHFLAWPNTEIKHGHWGGGIGGNYFFTKELGIGVDTAALDRSVHFIDHVGGNLIARIPIDAIHLAPYVFGGGGYAFVPTDNWFADVGAGLEFRFNPKIGIFADAQYIWKTHNASDQAAIRTGLRLVF